LEEQDISDPDEVCSKMYLEKEEKKREIKIIFPEKSLQQVANN